MALEDKIDALTAALNRNSDLLEVLTSKARSAQADPKKEDDAPKGRASTKDEEKKPEEEAPKRRTRAAAAPKAPTTKEMADKTTEFLDVEEDDEFQARRDLVKKLLAHFDAPKMSEIDEAKRQSALDALEAYKAGDDPFESLGGKPAARQRESLA